MERMSEEELKKELEKLKDFKVYAFEGDVYVKAEDYKKIAIENKKLKKEKDLYKARDEELNENCFGLAKENENLKSDLAFERTMLDNVRAEYKSLQNANKKLKEKVRFLEECLDRKEKLNEKYRKELKNYVYDAKQVRDIC